VRSAADIEGYFTLVNALAGAGQTELARELVGYFDTEVWTPIPDWWNKAYVACSQAVLGQDDAAMDTLQRIKDSPRLAWLTVVKDSFCFQRYAGEPAFQALLDHLRERQREMRERLPITLANFGVSLDHSPPK
jgi:hypothetical protein